MDFEDLPGGKLFAGFSGWGLWKSKKMGSGKFVSMTTFVLPLEAYLPWKFEGDLFGRFLETPERGGVPLSTTKSIYLSQYLIYVNDFFYNSENRKKNAHKDTNISSFKLDKCSETLFIMTIWYWIKIWKDNNFCC